MLNSSLSLRLLGWPARGAFPAVLYGLWFGCNPVAAQTALPGSIHGQVAAVLANPTLAAYAAPVSRIFVPDIDVWAEEIRTRKASAHVKTNAEGYFRTYDLPPGTYRICVAGKGYASRCDTNVIQLFRPTAVLPDVIEIQPQQRALHGTVWLADGITPCFWFSPSSLPNPLLAEVSLVDGSGKTLYGPVHGNASGQYVLPVSDIPDRVGLSAKCEAGIGETDLRSNTLDAPQNIAINNTKPKILSLDFTLGGKGARRAKPGAIVQATVQATDTDNNTLHYKWTDDSGRNLGLPDAPSVSWPLLNANALNTLHVEVSDLRGGHARAFNSIHSGPDELVFTGRVVNSQSNAGIADAAVSINGITAPTGADGTFTLRVKDAGQFVLNVKKPGYALSSQVLNTLAIGIPIALDPVNIVQVNAQSGGVIGIGPGSGGGIGCNCPCGGGGPSQGDHGDHEKAYDRVLVETDNTRVIVEKLKREGGWHHEGAGAASAGGGNCGSANPLANGTLAVTLPPDAFVNASGVAYTGIVSMEGFQYDFQNKQIPGNWGGVYQGKPVRLASFGAFHLTPRDSSGNALSIAPGKAAQISLPIQAAQQAVAPSTVPFFHYDEQSGLWQDDGTLTRKGDRYVGEIRHFSAFNADTTLTGGACVKVVLDPSFTLPVTLDAYYLDNGTNTFHHNGTVSSNATIGIERMTANQNFTLTITDHDGHVVTVTLYSGPNLNPAYWEAGQPGYDEDQVNFSHCNGPVQVYNNVIPTTEPYFLGAVFGPDPIVDNSAAYQTATQAGTGQARNTLHGWQTLNGFNTDGTPAPGEATAIYFNNGDLKFGRDMHCRVTNAATHAAACYVSNFGSVGTDDATTALPEAVAWESCGQCTTVTQPTATVAMEYSPTGGVQFFAYKSDGSYLAKPALDDEGPKPMPDICMACHQGSYSGGSSVNNGSNFLPFDLGSFLNAAGNSFPSSPPSASVQEQFRLLNQIIDQTAPPSGVSEVINLWYPGGVTTPNMPFVFTQGAAQLPGAPFLGHEPLYDNVVAPVCRTCHTSVGGSLTWDSYAQMNSSASFIQSIVCAPNYQWMPHAEVPWKRIWQDSLVSTLASELFESNTSTPNGCAAN